MSKSRFGTKLVFLEWESKKGSSPLLSGKGGQDREVLHFGVGWLVEGRQNWNRFREGENLRKAGGLCENARMRGCTA
jgi:hypothetical protein